MEWIAGLIWFGCIGLGKIISAFEFTYHHYAAYELILLFLHQSMVPHHDVHLAGWSLCTTSFSLSQSHPPVPRRHFFDSSKKKIPSLLPHSTRLPSRTI